LKLSDLYKFIVKGGFSTSSYEEQQIILARVYLILGVVLAPILLILSIEKQLIYGKIFISCIVLVFSLLLFLTFKNDFVKKHIHNILFYNYIAIAILQLFYAYQQNFIFSETLSFFTIIFIFSLVINNKKNLILFFTIIFASAVILINKAENSQVYPIYLILNLFLFFTIGYIVLNNNIATQKKLRSREFFLKKLFNETVDGFLIINFFTKEIIDCNDNILKLLELNDKKELIGYPKDKFQKYKDTEKEEISQKNDINLKGKHFKSVIYKTHLGKEFFADVATSTIEIDNNLYYISRITDITDKIENEKKIIESEKKYKSLFSRNVAGVFRTKLTGEIVEINESFAKTFGYTIEELMNKGIKVIYPNNEEREKYLNQLKEEKILYNYHCNLVKKNGNPIWALINVAIIEENNEQFIEGTLLDITGKQEKEIQLTESENRFKQLSEASFEGVAILNKEGEILEVNKGMCEMFGYVYEELLNMNSINLTEESSKALLIQKMQEKSTEPFEGIGLKKNGEKINLSLRGEPIIYKGKKATVAVVRDITQEIKAIIEIQNSKNRFETVINNTPDGIILFADEDYIYANPATLQILKLDSLSDFTSKSFLKFVKKDYHDIVNEALSKVEKGEEYNFNEIVLIDNNGKEILVEVKPILVNFYEKKAILIVVHDISFKKQIEKEKLRAQIAEESNTQLQKEINERIRIENELINSKQFTDNIINSSLDMIIASDTEGNITHFNKAAEKRFGYKAKELIGKKIDNLYFNINDQKRIIKTLLSESGKYYGEIVNIDKKGNQFISYLAASSLKDKDEKIIGYMGVSRDITEEKEAEQKLIESEEKYRDLFENSSDFIQSVDESGLIQFVNEAWLKALEYKEKEIIGQPFINFIHPDSKQHCLLVFSELTKSKKQQSIEFAYITKKGKKIIVEGNVSVKMKKGKMFATRGIFRDITQQKLFQTNLQEEKNRLSAIINNTSNVIFSIDKNYNIIESNTTFNKQLKQAFNVDNVIGRNLFDFIIDTINHDEVKKLYEELFKTGKNHTEVLKAKTPYGEKYFQTNYNPIKNTDKEVIGIAIFTEDITEKKLAEEEIRKSLKEKEILLAEIHHRVKNNLQVISSILNLQSSYIPDQKIIDVLRESQNRVKTMAFIHESLYQNKSFSDIIFSDYIKNLSQSLFQTYQVYQNNLKLELVTDDININIDQSIPAGLIVNELVSNALKHAFPNGMKGKITIGLKQNKENIVIFVSDNGVGIPKEINFETTKSLGLQLVSTLTEQLDGTLSYVTSTKGTKVEISFIKK
jgi:PAS domain S-box-containing protein